MDEGLNYEQLALQALRDDDPQRAKELFTLSGSPRSCWQLGRAYYEGSMCCEIDNKEACAWWERGAEQGSFLCMIEITKGVTMLADTILANGSNYEKYRACFDHSRQSDYLPHLRAAALDDHFPDAVYRYACRLITSGVEATLESQSYKLMVQAAQAGNVNAQYRLATGCIDMETAIYWLRRVTKQGYGRTGLNRLESVRREEFWANLEFVKLFAIEWTTTGEKASPLYTSAVYRNVLTLEHKYIFGKRGISYGNCIETYKTATSNAMRASACVVGIFKHRIWMQKDTRILIGKLILETRESNTAHWI